MKKELLEAIRIEVEYYDYGAKSCMTCRFEHLADATLEFGSEYQACERSMDMPVAQTGLCKYWERRTNKSLEKRDR